MLLSNTEMHRSIDTLAKYTSCTGILGYGIMRNSRLLREACTEYINIYNHFIQEYGEAVQHGNSTMYKLSTTSPNVQSFLDAIQPYAKIQHDVDIFKVQMSEAIKQLNADGLSDLEFMLVDDVYGANSC